MRQRIRQQLSFVESIVNHEHAQELAVIAAILSECPKIADLVYSDLIRGLDDPDAGRDGMMSGEQVYKALTIKQMNSFSYDDLAFHLLDSRTYRSFCGFGFGDDVPSSSTLQRDIKKVCPETLEAINRIIIEYARQKGIETGQKVRVDCTVVESNIHHPTDSSLLEDCVRVLSRLTGRAEEVFKLDIPHVNHSRRAKKRALEVLNAKSNKQRKKPYKDLLHISEKSVLYAESAVLELIAISCVMGEMDDAAKNAAKELMAYIALAKKVISQTNRRVMLGQKVPAEEKVVSIFEPHTDIIVKDRRDTYYGHKIAITGGVSGLLTDLVVEDGNPCDSTLAVDMIARQMEIYGRVPRQAAYDGGFASKSNLKNIKTMGVKDVSFAKKCGLKIADMTKSTWVYKKLRNFRAGIEGMISYLKRCFGLRRCNWRGHESFKSYAWSSIVTANLLLLSRHLLG
jgi:transposase, IS5 family